MLFSFPCRIPVAIILSRFCLCHVLLYLIKRHHITYIAYRKPLLHKDVSILIRRKPCKSCEIHAPNRIILISPKYKNRHSWGHEESLELYSILCFDWPTSKQKVSCHGNRFAAQVRRRYFSEGENRSDDRKYVCGWQARFLFVHDCLKRASFDVTCWQKYLLKNE